jgi:hypothetical protein
MRRSLIAVAAMLVLAGCGPAGSGEIAADERTLPPFDRIAVSEGLDLTVEVVPGATQSVTVFYDDNLVELIGTVVVDGELQVEVIDSFRVTGGGRFVDVVVGDLTVVHAASGADVRGIGEIEEITLEAESGAALDFSLLQAQQVVVEASGGSYVALSASDAVRGNASGGAEILVLGDPATTDIAVRSGAVVVSE